MVTPPVSQAAYAEQKQIPSLLERSSAITPPTPAPTANLAQDSVSISSAGQQMARTSAADSDGDSH